MSELRANSLTGSENPSPADFAKAGKKPLPEDGAFPRATTARPASAADIEGIQKEDKGARKHASVARKKPEEKIYKEFRRLMDAIVEELDKATDYLENDVLTDEGSTVTAEVDELLQRLAECNWGQGESLKLVVTVLRIPTRNARWTRNHVAFLQQATRLVRVQYLIDFSTVKMCKECLKAHGLDLFRGSVTEPEVVRRYKIVEEKPPGVGDRSASDPAPHDREEDKNG